MSTHAIALFTLLAMARLAAQTAAELEAKQGGEALAAARTWIHDGDPRHLAWAGYWAGHNNLTVLIPDLIKQLDLYQTGSQQWKGKAAPDDVDAEAIADALIRLNARVPEKTAASLYPKLSAQALILLSRSSEDPHATLEQIFKEDGWLNWLTAAELLAESHPRTIAWRLLDEFTIDLQVRVVRPGQKLDSAGGIGCVSDSMSFPDLTLPGWPSIREYKLTIDSSGNPEPAIELVVNGPKPVYLKSWETRFYNPYDPDSNCHLGQKAELRYLLIQQLSSWQSTTFPLKLHAESTIIYSSGPRYIADMEELLLRQRDRYESVVSRYQELGLITESDRIAAKVAVQLHVLSQLTDPLPEIDVENFGLRARSLE